MACKMASVFGFEGTNGNRKQMVSEFSSRGDGELINRYKNPNTSKDDKTAIANILSSRGYVLFKVIITHFFIFFFVIL